MTADDLTRRAIIAAHDAVCVDRCAEDVSTYGPLTAREQAIVALWRADRDDYQGRYEIAHESFLASERDREKAERAAQTLNGVIEQHARMILDITGLHDRIDDDGDGDWGAIWDHAHELRPRAEAAEAAIQRVLAVVHAWNGGQCITGYLIPNGDDSDSECLHCAAKTIDRALDGQEAANG